MVFLQKFPNNLVIILIKVYRGILSPSVGIFRFLPFYPKPTCIFYPTCSEYAIAIFHKERFLVAMKKTLNRIGHCHPGNEPSIDLP